MFTAENKAKDSKMSNSNSESECEYSICEEMKLNETIDTNKCVHRCLDVNEFSFKSGTFKSYCLTQEKVDKNKITKHASRILIVDDTPINRLVLTGMLKTLGYNPKEACNGEEAVMQILKPSNSFDIILMDVQMPIMDGIEATYKLRKQFNPEQLPIVGVTALSFDHELNKCIKAGMNEVMTKPLSLNDIKSIIRKYKLYNNSNTIQNVFSTEAI